MEFHDEAVRMRNVNKWSHTKKFISFIQDTVMERNFKNILLICSVSLPLVLPQLFMLSRYKSQATNSDATVQTQSRKADIESNQGRVQVCIFTGRWRYLCILLPYLYRELRQNGGVVDEVLFAMLGYTEETQVKLKNFSETANGILNDDAFQLVYFKTTEKVESAKFYDQNYYYVFQRIKENPLDVYFKIDDDIVHLRPNVFGTILIGKNSSDCFIHFANIVSNWRCNWIHQQIGVFDRESNPKELKIEYQPFANCGWKRADCAEMILRAFLHHYHRNQTSRYLFPKQEHTTDRLRFSINFFLLYTDLIAIRRLMEVGPINQDDELWLTERYSESAPHLNCVVGEALVVHFSYYTTQQNMLDLGLLKEFENIVRIELWETLPKLLWKALEFF